MAVVLGGMLVATFGATAARTLAPYYDGRPEPTSWVADLPEELLAARLNITSKPKTPR